MRNAALHTIRTTVKETMLKVRCLQQEAGYAGRRNAATNRMDNLIDNLLDEMEHFLSEEDRADSYDEIENAVEYRVYWIARRMECNASVVKRFLEYVGDTEFMALDDSEIVRGARDLKKLQDKHLLEGGK